MSILFLLLHLENSQNSPLGRRIKNFFKLMKLFYSKVQKFGKKLTFFKFKKNLGRLPSVTPWICNRVSFPCMKVDQNWVVRFVFFFFFGMWCYRTAESGSKSRGRKMGNFSILNEEKMKKLALLIKFLSIWANSKQKRSIIFEISEFPLSKLCPKSTPGLYWLSILNLSKIVFL